VPDDVTGNVVDLVDGGLRFHSTDNDVAFHREPVSGDVASRTPTMARSLGPERLPPTAVGAPEKRNKISAPYSITSLAADAQMSALSNKAW
jgi:hypothetical protein